MSDSDSSQALGQIEDWFRKLREDLRSGSAGYVDSRPMCVEYAKRAGLHLVKDVAAKQLLSARTLAEPDPEQRFYRAVAELCPDRPDAFQHIDARGSVVAADTPGASMQTRGMNNALGAILLALERLKTERLSSARATPTSTAPEAEASGNPSTVPGQQSDQTGATRQREAHEHAAPDTPASPLLLPPPLQDLDDLLTSLLQNREATLDAHEKGRREKRLAVNYVRLRQIELAARSWCEVHKKDPAIVDQWREVVDGLWSWRPSKGDNALDDLRERSRNVIEQLQNIGAGTALDFALRSIAERPRISGPLATCDECRKWP
jgi:hypothetical protein